jgi:hypothetical protein
LDWLRLHVEVKLAVALHQSFGMAFGKLALHTPVAQANMSVNRAPE